MTQPRPPRIHDPVERRIVHLKAAKARHAQQAALARLEREVAALGDPTPPSASEVFSQGSDARIQAILRDLTALEAACDGP
ncbi:hypothetical protein ASD79_15075 [Caulobacter sp. Root655]|uniref:hypothetical protein n=1 Tax=Caulobacter sp. Root655 TaxID=1736578 RepID=UPI0007013333|nr:hypothetical protein [Caulobacter sp. Root655]KRA58607.1 hypothetical protein ASD79_15075 [Caulobacter sp. Root655]